MKVGCREIIHEPRSLYRLLLTLLVSSQLCAALAQNDLKKTVFRIGNFDRSSSEFAAGNPERKVSFVVSHSDSSKDWFSEQPSVLISTRAPQTIASAPRAIVFSLKSPLADNYQFHVALLIETASVPALKIGINGKYGIFYLHPTLDYSSGDRMDGFDPAYSSADVEFTFPGRYLSEGVNTITLQPIEESEAAVPDAGINYDAIELDSTPSQTGPDTTSVQIVPTIFFQKQEGYLAEAVDAFIRYGSPIEHGGSAELTIGDRHYQSNLRSGLDFGEEKLEFLVREFGANAEAKLTFELNGSKQQYNQLIDPKKKWTVYVVPNIHLDVGFSDYQAKVAAIQSRTIDESLNMVSQHPDFRFSLDGEWVLEQFLASRSADQQHRAIDAIQRKELFVPAQAASLLTGLPTAETLIRSLYPSANFSRKYGTPFDYANITDVPTYAWSYASILADAGIQYFIAGSDNHLAPVLLQSRLNERSPMWWVGPDGKRVLLWYARDYQQASALFGTPSVLPAGHDTLPLFLQMYEGDNYHANAVILFGTQVENTDLFPQQAELAEKWNGIYAYPQLQYSGFQGALQNIEKQFGDTIPTIRGDGGAYWEDEPCADAYYLALERWNEARGQTAEKFATLASLVNPLLSADPEELRKMWSNMVLMDEHTWGSHYGASDQTSLEARSENAVKNQFAVNAAAEADFITRRSMATFANVIAARPGSLIVFNSLNWKRSGLVIVDLQKGDEIVDESTNQSVPLEVLSSDGSNFDSVQFLAQDVPSLGYKVFFMRSAQKAPLISGPQTAPTLESPYYRVRLDAETGAIRSIYDKQLNRELVSQDSPYRFGEYLYVTGGDTFPNTLREYSHVYPKPTLEIHPANKGRLMSVASTPFGEVAYLESQDLNTPSIKTEIRLFDREKKIEFVENIDKTEVKSKEAVYFAFPFSLNQPQFQYEIADGVVDPARDMYAGADHDWFSVQHWVSVQQDGMAGTVMPLDAPVVTLGDINRGEWTEQFGKRPGTIFSYVMNNYSPTNHPGGQGGHFCFHYEITSAASTSASDLSRLGWEEMTPLEADTVSKQDRAVKPSVQNEVNDSMQQSSLPVNANAPLALNGGQGSALNIEDPSVLLETWKPAEDGVGTIMRFLDMGGTERTVSVRAPYLHLSQAWQTDAVERDQRSLSIDGEDQFTFIMHPHEIVTVRVVEGDQLVNKGQH
jgi:hypothetical protein